MATSRLNTLATFERRVRAFPYHVRGIVRGLPTARDYVRRYGPVYGGLAFLKMLSRKPRVEIALPGFKDRIRLRPGTSDSPVFYGSLILQEWDLAPPRLNPDLIIDGGANIGCSTLFFAQRFPKSMIVAIEPEASNFQLLAENTRRYPNVVPIQAALWNRKSTLAIENPEDDMWAFRVAEASERVVGGVDALTVSDLMTIVKRDRIDLLKLNIEGGEKELFEEGFEPWLGKVRTIMIELHDRFKEGCSTAYYAATSGYGFVHSQEGNLVVSMNPALVRPDGSTPISQA